MNGIIHRLWLGPDAMPEAYIEYGTKWQELNPEWALYEWTPEILAGRLRPWRNQAVLDDIDRRGFGTVEAAVQKADVLGYELVYAYGGIYVNVDIEPIRSLRYMYSYFEIEPHMAYAGREDTTTSRIVNAVIGGPPQHPFWDTVIEALHYRYFTNPGADMVFATGPALLTDCVYSWPNDVAPFKILTQRAFNTVHWSKIPRGSNADGRWKDSPEVVGIHHWGHRLTGRSNVVGGMEPAT